MPVFALRPWSQFTRIPCASQSVDRLTFQGGDAIPLLLQDGERQWALDQAAVIDGRHFPAQTIVTTTGGAESAAGSFGHVVALDGDPVGLAMAEGRLAPSDRVVLSDAPHPIEPDPSEHQGVLCFAAGTQISTPNGPKRVETLRPGAMVDTRDNGPRPVIWTGRREVLFERGDNRFRPILFQAGSLGHGLPTRDLTVSPQHRLVVEGSDVAAIGGHRRMLAPAGVLAEVPGARQMLGKRRITYVHLLLDTHEVLIADGCDAESLYPHPRALAAMTDRQRAAIFELLPELRDAPETGFGDMSLPELDADDVRILLAARKALPGNSAELHYAAE